MASADVHERPFDLIVGVHDLSDPPDAANDELLSWMSFSRARPLLDTILANSRRAGIRLHVTSDDGFRSDYELLMPWLLDNKVGGIFFIVSRFLDRPGRLTTTELRDIAANGIRIGVHGASHLNWTKIPYGDFLADVREGKDSLEQALGAPVDCVAPPFGAYDTRIMCGLFGLGFREVHTCRPGLSLRTAAVKPRNMLKASQIGEVMETSTKTGGLLDALRCHSRRLCIGNPFRTGAA
jgi:peptidoglycan/xylan/chitin deacetylase (PgdA/CDA1 family)